MAFNYNGPINSRLSLRPQIRAPPPPPPPQVGPLQIRAGFGHHSQQPELDPQQQQMVQQQLMQMISSGHPMLQAGQLVMGPQGFPLPPIINEMHQSAILKEPLSISNALPISSKPDIFNPRILPKISDIDDNFKHDSQNEQDDNSNEKTERRRKRDRWGNQSTERELEPSLEERKKKDSLIPSQEDNDSNKSGNPEAPQILANPVEGQNTQIWPGLMQQMGTFPMVGVNPMGIVDPGMNSLMFGMVPQDGSLIDPNLFASGNAPPSKEIIECKDCTLYPPNPNILAPSTRKRPPGCKTIFVGGLPETMTEDMMREIFNRFAEMASVDKALYLSGYRLKIGSGADPQHHGKLHVDFAQARDDLHDWECQLRQIQREQRHREKLEQERSRIPSPPPVPHFNECEANALVEKIKAENSFMKALSIAVAWLERGECNKRYAHLFYCMLQATNSHVRRIASEKAQCEEELKKAKESLKSRISTLQTQFNQIERVFTSALHKKVWDHFSKAQRKNIEMWKKQAADINLNESQESPLAGGDEEMEVSDNEDEVSIRKKVRRDCVDSSKLKEENDSLRCQLEAYKNEIDLIRSDFQNEVENKDKELKIVQQTLKGTQQQLLESKLQHMDRDVKLKELEALLVSKSEDENGKSSLQKSEDGEADSSGSTLSTNKILERDAKLIGLISMFLHVHPFGAGVDYVWSFLQKLEPNLKPNEVETLMNRFPSIFQQELVGIGANMERRWQFIGFKPIANLISS